MIWRRLAVLTVFGAGLLVSSLFHAPPGTAQMDIAPCGYVDGFDFPRPGIDVSRTDFGIFRARFGGLHTGMDVSFEQLGEPVYAAARGRVTYSDPEGWDTEKGVVVILHTMPDGTQINTLYGHMEELNGYTFPVLNQCVEKGDIVGAVGFPSLGRPHLHFEVRTMYRHEGGPGYTQTNPLELGWLHPVDFVFLARIWVNPAYRDHFTLTENPTLPPLRLPDGSYVIAQGERLSGLSSNGDPVWRFDTLGSVISMAALPDGRVAFTISSGQVLVMQDGSVSALWAVPKPFASSLGLVGDTLVYATDGNTIMGLTSEGVILWETVPLSGQVVRWAVNEGRLAVATRSNDLYIVDSAGAVLHRASFSDLPIPFAGPDGGFWLLSGSEVSFFDGALIMTPLFDTGLSFVSTAHLLFLTGDTLYIYPGDGRGLYAYQDDGTLQWIAYMPGSHLRAPLLGIGGGQVVYALSTDGQLLAYDDRDGHLVAQLALYDGGIKGSSAARWLSVDRDDTVYVGGGYLSVVTLDGLALLESDAFN